MSKSELSLIQQEISKALIQLQNIEFIDLAVSRELNIVKILDNPI